MSQIAKGEWTPASNVVDLKKIDPKRFSLLSFNEIKLGSERRFIVKGLIPHAGLTVIWGPPKSGKSFWTFDLAMHIALGWAYRGRRGRYLSQQLFHFSQVVLVAWV